MMRRLSRRFIPVVMAILIIGQALAAPVAAVDYNGNPDTGPDPSNGIIFYDGKQAGVCAASSSGTAKQVASMPDSATLDQKIGQTFIVGFDASTSKDLIETLFKKYSLGGLYITGTTNAKAAGFDKTFFDKLSADAGIPIVASSDEEGVFARYTYSPAFPDAKSLASQSDSSVTSLVQSAAQTMATNGLTTDLAPVLDLTGIGDPKRNFSTDPSVVAEKAGAYAKGLEASGITPVFKHFPGFDGSVAGTNTDTNRVTLKTPLSKLESDNIAPYKTLLKKYPEAGLMLSNMYVQALDAANPSSISAKTVNYIRNTLGFKGMITTDDLAALTKYSGIRLPALVAQSLQSGVTMPLFQSQGGTVGEAETSMDSIIKTVKAKVGTKVVEAADTSVIAFKNSGATGATQDTQPSTCCAGSSILSGSDNMTKLYNFFISQPKPLTPAQASGVLGNIQSESGFMPERLQGTSIDTITPADQWQDINGGGWGIVQWTPGSKMINPTKSAGRDPNDLGVQALFLWGQLYGKSGDLGANLPEPAAGTSLRQQSTPESAANSFGKMFERFAGSSSGGSDFTNPSYGDSNYQQRAAQARAIYVKVTGGSTSLPPNATPATVSSCSSGSGDFSAYKNPFRDLKNSTTLRMDAGVDYGGNGGSGPIYAVGSGVVTHVGTNEWPGNPGAYVTYKLSDGPAAGLYIYIAEDCTPKVKVGDKVTSDTNICQYQQASTYLELGWSEGGNDQYIKWSDYNQNGGSMCNNYASNSGQDMSKFLQKLGVKPGIVDTGGTGACAGAHISHTPPPANWPKW